MAPPTIPDRSEASEYYFTYIDQVGEHEDICDLLEVQGHEAIALFRGIPDEASLRRYAPGKWSIRELLGHLNDTERLFAFRAYWFARGFDSPLPSFDQHMAVAHSGADARSWTSHIDEFAHVRAATVAFFRHLPADAWDRRGIASGNPFSVRALAYLAAGHLAHHLKILREQYLAS